MDTIWLKRSWKLSISLDKIVVTVGKSKLGVIRNKHIIVEAYNFGPSLQILRTSHEWNTSFDYIQRFQDKITQQTDTLSHLELSQKILKGHFTLNDCCQCWWTAFSVQGSHMAPRPLCIYSRLHSCIGHRPLEQKTLGFQFLCLFATAINWRFVNFIYCWWMLQGEKYCCFLLQILRCWQVAMSLVQTVKVLKMIPVLIATLSNVDISSMFRVWKPWIVNFRIMWTDKGAKSTCTQGWQ